MNRNPLLTKKDDEEYEVSIEERSTENIRVKLAM